MFFFDLEACPKNNEPLEVAAVDSQGETLFHSVVESGYGEPDPVNHRKGLTPAVVGRGQTREFVEQALAKCFSGSVVVSWNLAFDRKFFPRAFANAASCVCALLRYSPYVGNFIDEYNGFHRQSLGSAMKRIGFQWTGPPHRSLHDALATRAVWLWMLQHPADILEAKSASNEFF
tara:strand:- start:289 stop:813 length:525 start_codon:yes stop_codon:yes gene_type:complete